LVFAIAVIVLGVGAWLMWNQQSRLEIPDVHLDRADPEVAAAIRKAQDKIRDDPRSADVWGRYAMTLLANGFDVESDVPFAHAEKIDPANPRWPYLRGIALLSHNPDAAISCLERAAGLCRHDEERAVVVLRLAETLAANGHNEEAESRFRDVPAGSLTPCAEYGLGVLAAARGDLAISKEHLSRCVDSPLTRKKAAIQLVALSRRTGEVRPDQSSSLPDDISWQDSFRDSCMALAVGKQNRMRNVGNLEKEGRVQEAIQELRAMVRDYPSAEAYLALGIHLGRGGQFRESETNLRECLKLEPDRIRAQYYLSLALFGQAESLQRANQAKEATAKFKEAATWARRATELAPHNGEAHFQLGLAEWCLNHHEAAIAAFERAVATRPELMDPHLWLGKSLAAQGRMVEAKRHLENAKKYAAPNDLRAKRALDELLAGKKP
jgi:tetratricopeptide (TPR) repeat protein